VHTKKPTVLEKIITGLDYFRYSLFEAVCTTYRYVENSLNVSYSYTEGENILVSFWL
jgi:phosphoenolpyruvate carboxylase